MMITTKLIIIMSLHKRYLPIPPIEDEIVLNHPNNSLNRDVHSWKIPDAYKHIKLGKLVNMNSFSQHINKCKQIIEEMLRYPQSIYNYDSTQLVKEVCILAELLPDEYGMFKQRLLQHILPGLHRMEFSYNAFGQVVQNVNTGISPLLLGQLIATLDYLDKIQQSQICGIDWSIIHPAITKVSQERFNVGQYADSVEAAFKTINNEVKKIVYEKTGEEKDGNTLMQKAFSASNPIISFNDTGFKTDQDIQQGYQFMFSGAMLGIRNPKAHGVEDISKSDAIRKLHFASMLMFKLDERI